MAYRPSPLIRLRGLLADQGQWAAALPEAQRLAELQRRFGSVVPAAVARACRIASIQGDTAHIFCANGAAASRVRAQGKGVARALSSAEAPVQTLKVKVRADWNLPERPPKEDLPQPALNAFRELDQALPEGPLKDAVERLLQKRRG